MTITIDAPVTGIRTETDSLGKVDVPSDKLWGAQTQRSLEHFSIGHDLIPREMITAYATLKKGAANANHNGARLDDDKYQLILKTCDEILAGEHHDMFPLHVWMTGSGTQFNMNVNEVISNRCCQLAGTPLASKKPVHPNDHVNMSQSSNDTFPTAMNIAAAVNVKERLIPAVTALRDAIGAKSEEWRDIVKIGRTHMQDATPMTLGQEWSGYAGMLSDNLARIEDSLKGVYGLALGGTAVGTGMNAPPGFGEAAAGRNREIDWSAVRQRAKQFHRAGCPRRTRPPVWRYAYTRRISLQDRERYSAHVMRPARGVRRAFHSRKRTRLLDHAGKGESHSGGSAHHDRGTGNGKRCGRRIWRRRRIPRDERLQAADHLQRNPFHRAFVRWLHELPQIPRGRDETQSEKDPTIRGRIAHAGDRALTCHRLRQSVSNCALRDGSRPHAETKRAQTRVCHRG